METSYLSAGVGADVEGGSPGLAVGGSWVVAGLGGELPSLGFIVEVGMGIKTNVDVDGVSSSIIVGVNVGVMFIIGKGVSVIEGYSEITVSPQNPGPIFP